MDNSVVISTPPHVKTKRTTRGIMIDVVIALLPCAIAGIVYFGALAFMVEAVAVLSCIATEFVYFFIQNKGFSGKCANAKQVCVRWLKQFDFTSVVTGLILALILPSTAEWYTVIIGSVFSIAVVKMLFGGTGKNIVNPAAAGRIFMFLSFASVAAATVKCNFGPIIESSEVITNASNLGGLLPSDGNPASKFAVLDLLLGTGVAGCIGETCKVTILIGYVYLSVRQVIKWWQPLLFLGVFGISAWLLGGFFYEKYTLDIQLFLPNILSGGVMFAAVFMFPDYVTSPKSVYGQLVYYVAGALLLAILRYLTKIEVASFVVLLMNLLVPLIDRYIIHKPFGYKRQKTGKEGE